MMNDGIDLGVDWASIIKTAYQWILSVQYVKKFFCEIIKWLIVCTGETENY